MASTADLVHIRYRRPPDREDVYEQELVHRDGGCVITLLRNARLDQPIRIAGEIALEDGAPALWFTFPGEWFDIGRFHRRDGTFTGFYANVLTPVVFHDALQWHTTDLFLDAWVPAAGGMHVLDEDQFDDAVRRSWIDAATATKARAAITRILAQHEAGRWPPAVVRDWDLDRARSPG